jgi:nucleotide-binding universal stress UspA family protein
MYTHLLVPTDGTRLSEAAVRQAVELARVLPARLSVLHVITTLLEDRGEAGALSETAREAIEQRALAEAEAILAVAARQARAQAVEVDTQSIYSRDPARTICEEAERRGCDLIVMASHGRRGLESLLLGSETQKVLTHCKIPVLVVRQ